MNCFMFQKESYRCGGQKRPLDEAEESDTEYHEQQQQQHQQQQASSSRGDPEPPVRPSADSCHQPPGWARPDEDQQQQQQQQQQQLRRLAASHQQHSRTIFRHVSSKVFGKTRIFERYFFFFLGGGSLDPNAIGCMSFFKFYMLLHKWTKKHGKTVDLIDIIMSELYRYRMYIFKILI